MFHSFRDVLGKIGSVGDAAHALDIHTFGRDKGRPRPSRRNRDLDNPSAPRIVPAPKNFNVHMGPEPPDEGQEDPAEVVDGRRPADVRASDQSHPNGPSSRGRHREKGLQDERHTARGPDVEGEATRHQAVSRAEFDR